MICGVEPGCWLARFSPSAPVLPPALEAPPAIGELSQIGPYHVLAELGRSDDAAVLLGYDARLLRKVWLRRVSPATPPVATRFALSRPVRDASAGSTANEPPMIPGMLTKPRPGQPLLNLISTKLDWERIRFWLLDLAEELKAADKDGSLPAVLSLDRHLDRCRWPCKALGFSRLPGANSAGAVEPQRPSSPQEFLRPDSPFGVEGRPLSVEQARASTMDAATAALCPQLFAAAQNRAGHRTSRDAAQAAGGQSGGHHPPPPVGDARHHALFSVP